MNTPFAYDIIAPLCFRFHPEPRTRPIPKENKWTLTGFQKSQCPNASDGAIKIDQRTSAGVVADFTKVPSGVSSAAITNFIERRANDRSASGRKDSVPSAPHRACAAGLQELCGLRQALVHDEERKMRPALSVGMYRVFF